LIANTARNAQLQIAGQRLTANVALIQALGGTWETGEATPVAGVAAEKQ
jgi:outer membrane protein TolC